MDDFGRNGDRHIKWVAALNETLQEEQLTQRKEKQTVANLASAV